METLQALAGLAVFCAVAWLLSENRRALTGAQAAKLIAAGLGLQFAIALALLKVPGVTDLVMQINHLVAALDKATAAGTSFVFGYLGGGTAPFKITDPGASFILALRALPIVLVVSALSALLFYWRILPKLIAALAWALKRTLGIGGVLGITAGANVFIGMVEAPILVRPYLAKLTRSELFAMMSVGMATIAGTVMALYATILRPVMPDAAGHILIASLMSAPAAILLAHLMVPPGTNITEGAIDFDGEDGTGPSSAMEAVTTGTLQGVQLLLNITAMLIVMIALVHLVNLGLGLIPDVAGAPMTLQRMLGWLLAPLAWLMGIPWADAVPAGQLLGIKTVLNELIAFSELAQTPQAVLGEKTRLILLYALCGFANLGSLGIMLGGLIAMAPERRNDIVALAPKTIVSGLLATCMTGTVVGLL
jgi:CNT family concentrative nucleoside transporter